tara:strand:+ start:257 stop:403 length:147 start_codon:yes stop_codon:yes gene_type:complete
VTAGGDDAAPVAVPESRIARIDPVENLAAIKCSDALFESAASHPHRLD